MNPYLFGLYTWRETTTMHVTFIKAVMNDSKEEGLKLEGKLNISMIELLKCLISLKGNARGTFVPLLLLTFFRTYISQVPRGSHKEFDPLKFHQKPYPNSTLHEIQTGIPSTKKSNFILLHIVMMNFTLELFLWPFPLQFLIYFISFDILQRMGLQSVANSGNAMRIHGGLKMERIN